MKNKPNITFTPAKTQRASDVIYQQIYQKIADGELSPGDHLPSERELSEQFHRSRPSIREALRMLQQDGIIKIAVGVNGGGIVQSLSLENAEQPLRQLIDLGAITLRELADYRTYNDDSCAHLAAQHRTEEDIAILKDIICRYKQALYNPKEVAKVDLEFHKALAQSSHNKLCILITNVITELCTSFFWNNVATKMSEEEVINVNIAAYESHAGIVDAIISGDIEKLTEQMNIASTLFLNSTESVL